MTHTPKPSTLLIADDSAVVRVAVSRRAQAAGFDVVLASSFVEASAFLGRHFDAALLDLDLGDGDGAALAVALRTKDAELPIAFFSGGAVASVRDAATKAGPVFEKPDELDRALAWLLGAVTSRRRP